MTVKDPSIKLNQTEATLAVNETVKLTATTAPKSAASSVTYTTSDEKVATVANDGTVKAVAEGEATITATEKCGTKKPTATVKVTVKKVVLKEAKQTEFNKIDAVIVGDTKDLKAGDFKVTNTATNGTVAVKSVTAKKNVADTFVIETFTGMTDAKEYSVEYAGAKATFTATDGTVAKVGVTPLEVAAADKTPIQLTTIDANGVILSYTDLNNADSSKGKVTATTKYAKGYVDGTSIYLPSVGDTMAVEVTYHTGTWGTDGKETGNITDSFTITAVDPALINLSYAVTIASSAPAWKANSFKANNQVKLGADANAYFRIYKENNTDVDNYNEYTVESADKTKLLVNADTLTNNQTAVTVRGVAEGTTYILIKKGGTTVASLPIVVSAKPVATTLELSKTSISVMQGASVNETVTLTIKDQYGDKMAISSSKVENLGKPSKSTVTTVGTMSDAATFTTVGTNFLTGDDNLGTYTVKISAKNGDVELSRALTINVVKNAIKATDYEVRFDKAEVDTTIGDSAVTVTDTDINIQVAKKANGAAIANVTNDVQYTIKDSAGKVKYYNVSTRHG